MSVRSRFLLAEDLRPQASATPSAPVIPSLAVIPVLAMSWSLVGGIGPPDVILTRSCSDNRIERHKIDPY